MPQTLNQRNAIKAYDAAHRMGTHGQTRAAEAAWAAQKFDWRTADVEPSLPESHETAWLIAMAIIAGAIWFAARQGWLS